MQAATAIVPAAEAPAVTMPASAPQARATASPAARFSSTMSTKQPAASLMAASTSGRITLPPSAVTQLWALMTGFTPSRAYGSGVFGIGMTSLLEFSCRSVRYAAVRR